MADFFISENFIKENTPLNNNVEITEVNPFITAAQDLYLTPILGSKLFSSLLASYVAQTLTPDEITLVSKIKPALAWRALSLYLPFAKTEIRNKGTQNLYGQYEANAELKEMQYIREEAKNNAEFYEQKLTEYLCNYGKLYPDYVQPDTKGTIPNSETKWDCDLIFYDNRNRRKENKNYL